MLHRAVAVVTRAGWAALACGAAAYLAGWLLGWIELMVVAAGLAVALAVAVLFIVGRTRLHLERTIEPERVTVGEPSLARLVAANERATPTTPVYATDWVGDEPVPVEIPVLGPGTSRQMLYSLPTDRRGVVDVGPVVIAKSDPLGLMRRESLYGERRRLWIHPETTRLPPLPAGFAKDLEGPTSDVSPKGDVAFHTLREYVHGDEYRHIHWKSSARLGTLMVRQYVDNRRPHLTVVFDTRPDTYRDDTFEVGVSCATSLASLAFTGGQSVSVYCGADPILSALVPAGRNAVLDHFAAVERAESPIHIARIAASAVERERATSTTVVVSGALPPQEVVALGVALRGSSRLIVARAIGSGDRRVPALGSIDVLNFTSLRQFRGVWVQAVK